MAWLSNPNFNQGDTIDNTDLNNLAQDIKFWGGDVNAGGYNLFNVQVKAYPGGGLSSEIPSPVVVHPYSFQYPVGVTATLAAGGSLVVATPYYYVVTSVNGALETIQSAQVTKTPTTGNQTINLSWTPVADAASYKVYRSLVSGNFASPALIGNPTTNSFSDTGVPNTAGTPPTTTDSSSQIQFANTAMQERWVIMQDGSAETGGNAGSNFVLSRFNDAGVVIDSPITISRATGNVTIKGVATDPTTTIGDLIMRGSSVLQRFGVGNPNQVLMVDSSNMTFGISWKDLPPSAPQTPWASSIDAAGYNLSNVGQISINNPLVQPGLIMTGNQTSPLIELESDGTQYMEFSSTIYCPSTKPVQGLLMPFYMYRGTSAAPLPLQTGDVFWDLSFRANDTTVYTKTVAEIKVQAAANYAANSVPTDIIFYFNQVETLRFRSTGRVGINNSAPAYTLDVTGDINLTGTLRQNGVAFTTGVASFNTRTGAVTARQGDYTAAQVTNAVDQTATYTNPTWITQLPWSVISGSPSTTQITTFQTPWQTSINANFNNLTNLAQLTIADPTGAEQSVFVVNKATSQLTITGGMYVYLKDSPGLQFADNSIINTAPTVFGPSGSSHKAGYVPDPGSTPSGVRYLREDQSWAVPAATGGVADPTTTPGDMLVRGSAAVQALPIGTTNGMMLTVDTTQPLKVRWAAPGAAGVSSFNGRTGAVVSTANDYTAAMVTNAVSTLGSYSDPGWITALSYTKLTNVPSIVNTFNGRFGTVVPASGDYTPGMVGAAASSITISVSGGLTGGGDLTQNRSIAGVVMGGSGASHAMGMVPDPGSTAGTTRYLREDGIWFVPPVGTGGAQTPWTSDINAANFGLSSVLAIGVGAAYNANYGIYITGKTIAAALMGNVGIGNNGTPPFPPLSYTCLTIGNGTGAGAGELTLTSNYATSGGFMGALNWANLNNTAQTDMRVAYIAAFTDTTGPLAGYISFVTYNSAGTRAENMRIISTGQVGIQNTQPAATLDVGGTIRSTGLTGGITGVGIEIGYATAAPYGFVQAYDRGAAAYKPLHIEGNATTINAASGATVCLGTATADQHVCVDGGNMVIRSGNMLMFRPASNAYDMDISCIAASSGYNLQIGFASMATVSIVHNTNGYTGIGNFSGGAVPGSMLTVAGVGVGSVVSPNFVVTGPALGSTLGSEVLLGSFGLSTVNGTYLTISSYRSSAGSAWNNTDFFIGMNVDSTTRAGGWISISGTGNVGVKKAAPAYALDVTGDINCTGAFRVNGTAISTGVPGAWSTYTPTVKDAAAATLTTSSMFYSYMVYGTILFVVISFVTTTTANSGSMTISLPTSIVANNQPVTGYAIWGGGTSNQMINANGNGANITISLTNPSGQSTQIYLSGHFRIS